MKSVARWVGRIAPLFVMAIALAGCGGDQGVDEDALPVIFVPGITGSVLYWEPGGIAPWPPGGVEANVGGQPPGPDFQRLSLNPATAPHEPLIPTDVIRAYGGTPIYGPFLEFMTGTGGYVEYNVNGDPSRRTGAGCDTSQEPTPNLFVFAYDWRLAIEDNAALLDEYVDCVEKIHPDKQVNIVTHSMGGLVARRYIIDHPGRVEKLVTVAAPFLGSAKPLYQMIYGKLSAEFSVVEIVTEALFSEELKDMLAYYPGLHELMASRTYYALGGPPYTVVETLTGALSDLGVPDTLEVSYADLMGPGGVIDQLFPNPGYNGKTPARSNHDFHSYTANGNSQDDWSSDTTGVKYYHLVGVQKANNTPGAIREAQGITAIQIRDYSLDQYGQGDQTVPRLSAERLGNGLDLNAPNAKLFVFDEGDDQLLEHTGLMVNRAVLERVLTSLREQEEEEEPVEEGLVVEIHAMTPHRTVIEGRALPEISYITGEILNNSKSYVTIRDFRLEMSDSTSTESAILLHRTLGPGESTPFEAAYGFPAADADRFYEGEFRVDQEQYNRRTHPVRAVKVRVSNVRVQEAGTSSISSVRATLTNEWSEALEVSARLVVWQDGEVLSVRPGLSGFRNEIAPGESVDVTFEVRSGLPMDDVGVVAFAVCDGC